MKNEVVTGQYFTQIQLNYNVRVIFNENVGTPVKMSGRKMAVGETMSREKNGMGDNLYGLYQNRPECVKIMPGVGGLQTRIGMVGHHARMGRKNDMIKSPVYHRRFQVV